MLRAAWSVKALEAAPATGLVVRAGPMEAESMIAVLDSEAERYLGDQSSSSGRPHELRVVQATD